MAKTAIGCGSPFGCVKSLSRVAAHCELQNGITYVMKCEWMWVQANECERMLQARRENDSESLLDGANTRCGCPAISVAAEKWKTCVVGGDTPRRGPSGHWQFCGDTPPYAAKLISRQVEGGLLLPFFCHALTSERVCALWNKSLEIQLILSKSSHWLAPKRSLAFIKSFCLIFFMCFIAFFSSLFWQEHLKFFMWRILFIFKLLSRVHTHIFSLCACVRLYLFCCPFCNLLHLKICQISEKLHPCLSVVLVAEVACCLT